MCCDAICDIYVVSCVVSNRLICGMVDVGSVMCDLNVLCAACECSGVKLGCDMTDVIDMYGKCNVCGVMCECMRLDQCGVVMCHAI